MYIQVTNKCNMKCAHCCFSCTTKGQHMSLGDIRRAIFYAESYESLAIGGGEPTLCPDLFKALDCWLSETKLEHCFMVTNG